MWRYFQIFIKLFPVLPARAKTNTVFLILTSSKFSLHLEFLLINLNCVHVNNIFVNAKAKSLYLLYFN